MPERRRPNYFARVVAIMALFGAFALVIATIATSGGDEGDGDTESKAEQKGITKKGERALENGVWVVRDGDTLVSISDATGIDLDELVELNRGIDPQALIAGQRVSLRVGQADGDSDETTTTDTSEDPADDFGDGSVGDDTSSDTGDGTSSP